MCNKLLGLGFGFWIISYHDTQSVVYRRIHLSIIEKYIFVGQAHLPANVSVGLSSCSVCQMSYCGENVILMNELLNVRYYEDINLL